MAQQRESFDGKVEEKLDQMRKHFDKRLADHKRQVDQKMKDLALAATSAATSAPPSNRRTKTSKTSKAAEEGKVFRPASPPSRAAR